MEKGSRHTFDVGGFTSLLKRLSENKENNIATPVFDRKLDISRNCYNLIDKSTRHLIIEGNYLLLKESPWINLSKYYVVLVIFMGFFFIDFLVLRLRFEPPLFLFDFFLHTREVVNMIKLIFTHT